MEILVFGLAFLVAAQSAALVVMLFMFFPRISKNQVHRAMSEMHMDVARSTMDPQVTALAAEEAEQEALEKPFGVDSDTWESAIELSRNEGCTIDDALLTLQALPPDGDMGPRGT